MVKKLMVEKFMVEKLMVEEFMVEKLMVEEFMVEKFIVEISCNLFEQSVYPMLQTLQSKNFCPYTHQLF